MQALRTGNLFGINILISRNIRTTVWCYLIALSPAILIFVLLFQLAVGAAQVTLEAGVGIIAILPLRQVLVPSDVGGITRIDLILGMELVAMLVLVAISVTRQRGHKFRKSKQVDLRNRKRN